MTLQDRKTAADKIRHTMLDLGWDVRPSVGKQIFLPKWNAIGDVTHDLIDDWSTMQYDPILEENLPAVSTGIRLSAGMIALDADVPDQDTSDAIMDVIEGVIGADRFETAPARHSGEAKFMMLFKCDVDAIGAKVILSPDYVDSEGRKNQFEVYTGAHGGKFFGLFGPHSYDDDGEVAKMYGWMEGPTPATIAPDLLPVLTWSEVQTIVMLVNDTLDEMLHRVETSESVSIGRGAPDRLFDLDANASFDTAKHGLVSYKEALALAQGSESVSCSASCLDGLAHENRTRCTLSVIKGALAVYDFQSGQIHMPASAEGEYDGTARVEKTEAFGEALRKARPNLVDFQGTEDWVEDKVADMMDKIVFCDKTDAYHYMGERGDDPIKASAISRTYNQRVEYTVIDGRNGAEIDKVTTVGKIFMAQEGVRKVKDIGFDPREGDLYGDEDEEDFSATHLNTFEGLPDLGEPDPRAVEIVRDHFIPHLVPDAAERQFFMDWLASKYQRPWVRNCGLLFLAAGVGGAGRGAFFDIVDHLFGRYSIKLDQDQLFEKHNAWADRTLLVMADELGSKKTRTDKAEDYQMLKSLVDPSNTTASVRRMRQDSVRAHIFTSFMMATNRITGVKFDAEDRRFAVISQGLQNMSEVDGTWADEFHTIVRQDKGRGVAVFAAALSYVLREHVVQTSDKDLVRPPHFKGWSDMVGATKDDLDIALDEIAEENTKLRAWAVKDFRSEVRLHLHGDSKARRGDFVTETVATLAEKAKADSVGLWMVNQVRIEGGLYERGTRKSVVTNNVEAFMALSPSDRADVLLGGNGSEKVVNLAKNLNVQKGVEED